MTWVLAALAVLVVVITRLRLRTAEGPGRSQIARGPVHVHTVCGTLAIVTWVAFLLTDGHLSEGQVSLIGLVSLVLWWVTALAGLLVLVRWLPNRGAHAAPVARGEQLGWAAGPGLSLLGHLGMVVGAAVFTYAYLTL